MSIQKEMRLPEQKNTDTPKDQDASQKRDFWGGGMMILIEALLLALIVRTFFFQPFVIPSGSMLDTLRIGDYLFVSKFSYGYSQHSFPFSLFPFSGRVWDAPPKRGDIVVFKSPGNTKDDYIKRVIGLPGDRIQMKDSVLYINDQPVKREKNGYFSHTDSFGNTVSLPRYRETLPNGVSYDTLDMNDHGSLDNTPVYDVPEGHFFMMGDNRDNSQDSRVLDQVGYVPYENLVGRAEILFFSVKDGIKPWMIWRWPQSVRWDRLFKLL